MNDGKRWWIVTVFWQAEDRQESAAGGVFEEQKLVGSKSFFVWDFPDTK